MVFARAFFQVRAADMEPAVAFVTLHPLYSFLAFARLRRFWFATFFARIVCFRLDVRGCCRTLYHCSQLRYFLVVGVASRDNLLVGAYGRRCGPAVSACSFAAASSSAVVCSAFRRYPLPTEQLSHDSSLPWLGMNTKRMGTA